MLQSKHRKLLYETAFILNENCCNRLFVKWKMKYNFFATTFSFWWCIPNMLLRIYLQMICLINLLKFLYFIKSSVIFLLGFSNFPKSISNLAGIKAGQEIRINFNTLFIHVFNKEQSNLPLVIIKKLFCRSQFKYYPWDGVFHPQDNAHNPRTQADIQ